MKMLHSHILKILDHYAMVGGTVYWF